MALENAPGAAERTSISTRPGPSCCGSDSSISLRNEMPYTLYRTSRAFIRIEKGRPIVPSFARSFAGFRASAHGNESARFHLSDQVQQVCRATLFGDVE